MIEMNQVFVENSFYKNIYIVCETQLLKGLTVDEVKLRQ